MTTTADTIRVLGDEARELGKLSEHPSWATLKRVAAERREQYQGQLARRLINGGFDAPPLSQREIDYQRGFFRGIQFILDNPDIAEQKLLRALERRERGSG